MIKVEVNFLDDVIRPEHKPGVERVLVNSVKTNAAIIKAHEGIGLVNLVELKNPTHSGVYYFVTVAMIRVLDGFLDGYFNAFQYPSLTEADQATERYRRELGSNLRILKDELDVERN